MMNIRTAIALLSAGFIGTACAANGDNHTHRHHATAGHSHQMMKDGGASSTQSVTKHPTASKATMMLADAKGNKVMTDGQVKRINKSSKKITIKHGEIANLEMPPMTMVFRVADENMLDQVKKGDKVKFHVEERDGAMVITEITTSK